METKKRSKLHISGLIAVTLIIAAATYGFASSTAASVPGSSAGEYGVQSSYPISGVTYTLDEEDPEYFTGVTFRLDQAEGSVHAGVSAEKQGPITWAESCQQEQNRCTCTFQPSLHVLEADWLHVAKVK